MADLLHDFRLSVRSLRKAPTLTATILLTVGLGIGATTVIFGAIYAALLRPLPYSEPGELVRIYTDSPPFQFRFSLVDYLALHEQQTHFAQVAAYTNRTMAFSDGNVAERVIGRVVSWSYFDVLGITPAIGRSFTEMDGRQGSAPAVIVSHAFWQRRLGGRLDVIGTPIRLDGSNYALAGVLPAAVGPLEQRQDFFLAAQWERPRRRGPFLYTVIARLKDGADRSAIASELHAINKRIYPLWKASYQDERATWRMMDLKRHVTGDAGTIAGLALAAAALVWLIACANASNLIVARVTSRRRELAVRAALGASRGRVMRHLLVESALLAIAASVIGIGVAAGGIRLLQAAGADYFPRTAEVALDGPVLAVLVAVALTSALLFGLLPALHGSSGSVDDALRSGGRSSTGNLSVRRVRRLLVGSQFAIATPLLVIAGLLLASLNELRRVDLGFDSRNVLTASISLPAAQYPDPDRITAFWDEFQRRIATLPGVVGVAFADGRPPDDVGNFNNFDLEDLPTPAGQSQPVTPWVAVTPEYFHVLGLELLEGRLLDDRDGRDGSVGAVVVDRAWARRFFPNGSAVGKRFKEGGCTECPWTTVVGVVSEVKYAGLDQPDHGTVYWPMVGARSANLIVRTATDPSNVAPAVRQGLRDLDASLPLSSVATIDDMIAQSLRTPRSLSLLVGGCAAVALLLSIVGIYGVMAYYVQQHAKDISIRLALGGGSHDVLRLVVGQGMRVVAAGVGVGVLSALAATQLMSTLLFGISAADPSTFAAASGFLVLVALIACLVPARQAIRLEPAALLRNE